MLATIREIFLQESCPEVSLGYRLYPGLHQLLHSYPLVLRISHQQEGDEGQSLCISPLYHSIYFLALPHPCICLVRSGLTREFCWPVPHEVLHGHRANACHHDSRLCCDRLHRIDHSMYSMSDIISSSSIPPPSVSHCLSTPVLQLFTPNNLSHDYTSQKLT